MLTILKTVLEPAVGVSEPIEPAKDTADAPAQDEDTAQAPVEVRTLSSRLCCFITQNDVY